MKEKHKRIIMIIFLVFALFAVGGKLLGSVDTHDSSSNPNSKNTEAKYNTNNYNYSQDHKGINITAQNYEKYYEAKGFCDKVVDGDTIDVSGVGRVRLVGIDTPERGQSGYENSTEYVKKMCLGKAVYLDIDDAKNRDKYDRLLAVVYVDGQNLNEQLLKKGYAEIMYIPPSEFDPYKWT